MSDTNSLLIVEEVRKVFEIKEVGGDVIYQVSEAGNGVYMGESFSHTSVFYRTSIG